MKKIFICIFLLFFSCEKDNTIINSNCFVKKGNHKINGGAILQTPNLVADRTTNLAKKTNANWVSLSPILSIEDVSSQAFPYKYRFLVSDEVYKMKIIIPNIIKSNIRNIMIKPSTAFWKVNNSFFWGDFYVESEKEWKEIERAYEELFYELAKLSNEFPEVKLLSVGNELREFTKRRPNFFKKLILRIKQDFPNLKLTYSANWDEYKSVTFWDNLDYIGVNPYFPLVNKKTPTVSEVKQALTPIKKDLKDLSCRYEKPILFTEYGYRSIDYGTWKAWLLENITTKNYNFATQSNAYTAFYETFWDEDWVSGGFFWEWKIVFDRQKNNPKENGWYINDKPVEKIIKDRYSR